MPLLIRIRATFDGLNVHCDSPMIEKISNYDAHWIERGSLNMGKFPQITFDIKDVSSWPEKTDIRCWFCTRNFDNSPIGLPYRYYKGVYYVRGCFCTFACAYTYNIYFGDAQSESLLYQLYHDCGFGAKIRRAPDKELMIEYGGNLTSGEYQALLKSDEEKNIRINMPPSISLAPEFRIVSIKSNAIDSFFPLLNHKTGTGNKYRIFRRKPLHKS